MEDESSPEPGYRYFNWKLDLFKKSNKKCSWAGIQKLNYENQNLKQKPDYDDEEKPYIN